MFFSPKGTCHMYYNSVGETGPHVFLVVHKALERALHFSALDSLKLGLNEGMSCPGMTAERANSQSRLRVGSLVSSTFCTQDAVRAGAVRGAIDATKVLLVLLDNKLL